MQFFSNMQLLKDNVIEDVIKMSRARKTKGFVEVEAERTEYD